RMRSVLDNVSDGLATLDQTGVIEAVNPAVTRLFGYEEKELVGQKIEVLIATTHRGSFMSYVERRLTLELPASGALETMGKRKNASLFPLEFLVSSMQVGPRRKGGLRATDTIARLGGDEFAVVSIDARHPDNVVATARKILASLEGPFTIADQQVETGASIGIAMYPIHGDDPGTLLRR